MPEKTEIVIIGAGPTGSLCALRLSQAGHEVVLLERKPKVGLPKQCAECIPEKTLTRAGIKISKRWFRKRFSKAFVFSPSGKKTVFNLSNNPKIVIDRKIFDNDLVQSAKKAGARLRLRSNAINIKKRKGLFIVDYMAGKKTKRILSRFVIIATGVDSRLARTCKFATADAKEDMMNCFQYELEGISCEDALSIYFGQNIAPKGYLWIFPKSKTRANVGVGLPVNKQNPKTYLDRFLRIRGIYGNAKIIETNAGLVPLSKSTGLYKDGIFLVGDCARVVNPAHGGGLEPGLFSAKFVSEAIISGYDRVDFSSDMLRTCEVRWHNQFGRKYRFYHQLKNFFFWLSDSDLEYFLSFPDTLLNRMYRLGNTQKFFFVLAKRPLMFLKVLSILVSRLFRLFRKS